MNWKEKLHKTVCMSSLDSWRNRATWRQ